MKERVKIYSKDGISLVIPENEDSAVWYKYANLPEVSQYLGSAFGTIYTESSSLEEYKTFNKKKDANIFSIYDEEKAIVIGIILIRDIDNKARKAELAVMLFDLANTSKGVGTIAMKLIQNHAFEVLGLHKIFLHVLANNDRAIACYRKCGFKEVGRLKDHNYIFGKYIDEVFMEVFSENISL